MSLLSWWLLRVCYLDDLRVKNFDDLGVFHLVDFWESAILMTSRISNFEDLVFLFFGDLWVLNMEDLRVLFFMTWESLMLMTSK